MSKKTPQIRFKGFTDDWEERKLSEIGKIVTGNTPNTSNKDYYNGDFLFVSPADIQENRYVNKTTTTLTELGFKTGRLVPKGATLFVSIGSTIGKTGQSICDVITNQQINSVISFSDYDDDFIYTSILNSSTKIKQLAATQAVPIINKNEFGKSIIKIPSLEEQQKIGAFFKQLDDIIALHQRKLDLLKEQKKGFLQKMFPQNGARVPELRFSGFADDWEDRKLGDFLRTPEKVKAHIQSKDDLMTLKLNLGGLESGSNRETLELGSTIYYKRKAGQFIYGKQNFFNGSMAIIPIDLDGKATSGDVPSLDVVGILSEYLYVYVSRGDYWKSKESEASGTGSKRIHEKTLQGFDIKVPSTQNEQRKIGSFFKQLDNTIALHQRKLDLLKEQKKGFLQKMFVS